MNTKKKWLVIAGTGLFSVLVTQAAVTEAWARRYSGPANSNDVAKAVALDSQGNVFVTGLSHNGTNDDFYTAKYAAANGALLWERRYNRLEEDEDDEEDDDMASALAVDAEGNAIVTGRSSSRFYTAKYAGTNGAVIWEKLATNGSARAVVVDSNGDVIVTGTSPKNDFLRTYDYYTAKYAGTDGALLWEQLYPDDDDQFASATGVALDSNGNVFVTGTHQTKSQRLYNTLKYAATNGTQLWQRAWSGPIPISGAAAVAVDNEGNVIVTGATLGSPGQSDYWTAKYAAANGALLWQRLYNGPANSNDIPRAVALDSSGNVFVTGTHNAHDGLTADFYTAKYAAANGALLWERTYNGPDNDYDHALAIAVDAAGNAIVTGTSESDAVTLKYAGTDGRVLWEKRTPYRSDGEYVPSGLVVGPNGMVVITGTFTDENDETDDYITIVYRESPFGMPGSVVAWGENTQGQSMVPIEAQSGVVAIAAGEVHTVALKSDGRVLGWGTNHYGQLSIPSEAESGVIAIAAGEVHTVALKNNGRVLAWGYDELGQSTVPTNAHSGVIAIAAGEAHTVALKNDGRVIAWGWNGNAQTNVPVAAESGVISIAAGGGHTVALKTNGSVVAWGWNAFGQATIPVAAQSGVIAIAAGWAHTVALKDNGSVLVWGLGTSGQTNVPSAAQSGVVAVAAGDGHCVALKNDGSVVAWGHNFGGQTTVPSTAQSGVRAIAAGLHHTLAIIGEPSPFNIRRSGNKLILTWSTNGVGFSLQSSALVPPATWVEVTNVPALLGAQWVVTNSLADDARFYRLQKQ